VLLARARRHFVTDFAGPLSIKHVVQGRVHWNTGHDELWVDDASLLILNDGEPYSLHIDGAEQVETCCVFFQTGFVESIANSLSTSEEHLLDDPFRSPPPLPFLSRLHQCDHKLTERLTRLREWALRYPSRSESEDHFVALAQHLLGLYEEMRLRLTRVPAARASTRLELLKRIERGREFLHADANAAIGLSQIATAACLSPFHFHRAFTSVFGKTPHAYLSAMRLDRAMRMLGRGVSVTDACFAVGFESVGSFSTLFRRRFGQPPSAFIPTKFARSEKQ
jgi:AraC family transcriptional regulator